MRIRKLLNDTLGRRLALLAAAGMILFAANDAHAQKVHVREGEGLPTPTKRTPGDLLIEGAIDGRDLVTITASANDGARAGSLPVIFGEDFQGPLLGNVVGGVPGTGVGQALWHGRNGGNCSTGGSTRVAAFTRDPQCNYATGSRERGAFTTALVDYADSTQISLSFDNFRETENTANFDLMQVYLVGGSLGAPILIADLTDNGQWENTTIDLSSFGGSSFRIAFFFDSVDRFNNNFRGWWVDNIEVRANGFGCDGDQFRAPSIGAEDGYVREPNLLTMAEGPFTTKGTTAQVGDDGGNWQNRAVLSFDTSGIPDEANITTVTLRLTRSSSAGNVASLGRLVLDMGDSLIGEGAELDFNDFDDESAAALDVASSFPVPAGNGFTTFAIVDPEFHNLVDQEGTTQVRVRFENPTDGDGIADYLNFHMGEALAHYRPELIVDYGLTTCFEPETFDACDGPFEATIWSSAAEDGGVGESHYTSEVGGSSNAGSGTSTVGDTGSRTQQMLFLHFDTSGIPTDATITSAELRLYRSSAVGTAAANLGPLVVDMRVPGSTTTRSFDPFFGSSEALEAADFQSFSHFPAVATLTVPASNTYTSTFLNTNGLNAINKGANTQMRVRFTLPDDGDFLADQVSFGTGNFGATSPGRPRLVVTYMTPCGP
jgi:hypothetical protein